MEKTLQEQAMELEREEAASDKFGGAKWFITFPFNSDKRNKYWLPGGQSYNDARTEVWSNFEDKWAFMYPISDLERQINEYNLTEL